MEINFNRLVSNIQKNYTPKNNFSGIKLNTLKKDTVSFSGTNKTEEIPSLDPNKTLGDYTGWYTIERKPQSQFQPPFEEAKSTEEFRNNINRYAHPEWRDATNHLLSALNFSKFQIYAENGVPKLGVMYKNEKTVMKILSERNHNGSNIIPTDVPAKYFSMLKEYIQNNGILLDRETMEYDYKKLEKRYEEMQAMKAKIDKSGFDYNNIDVANTQKLFDCIGIPSKINDDNMLVVKKYRQPVMDTGGFEVAVSFDDLGIDENKLLENIVEIEDSANFDYSKATGTGNVRIIGEVASFINSDISDIGNLERIKNISFMSPETAIRIGTRLYEVCDFLPDKVRDALRGEL